MPITPNGQSCSAKCTSELDLICGYFSKSDFSDLHSCRLMLQVLSYS